MTREEAIKIIDCYDIGFYDLSGEKIPADKLAEAFDMAIEALQADTVSREEYDDVKAYMDKLVDAFIEDGEELADAVEVVRCGECKYKRLYDDGDTKYYYCALEDRPNRNWSVDDTDYCSWGKKREVEE